MICDDFFDDDSKSDVCVSSGEAPLQSDTCDGLMAHVSPGILVSEDEVSPGLTVRDRHTSAYLDYDCDMVKS